MTELSYGSTIIGAVPDGWSKTRINSDLVDIQSGFACAKNKAVADGVAHLRPFNVTLDGEVVIGPDTVQIPPAFRDNLAEYHLQTGDVLYNNTNSVELVGKSAIVREPYKVAFSNHLNRLRVRNSDILNPAWLVLTIRTLHSRGFFAAHCNKWIGQAGFSVTALSAVEIPLPPIFEQQRILTRVKAMVAELREMRRLNNRIRENAERMMEAVLGEVFPSIDEPMPRGWTIHTVGQLCEKPQYGYTQSAKSEPIGPKFLRITDIQNGKVDWNTVPYCICDVECMNRYGLQDDDILFARSGATTGKTYIVKSPPESVFASYLIRLKTRAINPDFLYWFFQSSDYGNQITPMGAAIPNMNATLLSAVRVPVVESVTEQRRLVEYFSAVRTEISEMLNVSDSDSKHITKMEQGILDMAFRGEL